MRADDLDGDVGDGLGAGRGIGRDLGARGGLGGGLDRGERRLAVDLEALGDLAVRELGIRVELAGRLAVGVPAALGSAELGVAGRGLGLAGRLGLGNGLDLTDGLGPLGIGRQLADGLVGRVGLADRLRRGLAPGGLALGGVGDRLGGRFDLDLVGRDRLGDRGLVFELRGELDRVEDRHVVEGRRLRQVLGHRREVGRVVLAEEALEELRHLLLEGRNPRLDELDLALDHHAVLLDLGLEAALASRDPGLGLLADPGDLGLRPLTDRGDVVVGLAAEGVRFGRGALVDLVDVDLGVGLELAQRRVPGLLGGRLHGLGEVGQELARALRGRRLRHFGRGGRLDLGGGRVRGRIGDGRVRAPGRVVGRRVLRSHAPRVLGRGRVRLGPATADLRGGSIDLVGLGLFDVRTLRAPREPEAGAGVGLSHGCGASPMTARGFQGVGAFCRRRVGVVESARGTANAFQWYRQLVRSGRCVVEDLTSAIRRAWVGCLRDP